MQKTTKPLCLLVREPTRWVCVLTSSGQHDTQFFDDSATVISDMSQWLKKREVQELVIALDSQFCLSTGDIDTADVGTVKYEVLKFEAESELPWAAEDFELALLSRDDVVNAIAVKNGELKRAIVALESVGVRVVDITAASILVAEFVRRELNCDVLVIAHEANELLRFDSDLVRNWEWYHASDGNLKNALDKVSADHQVGLVAFGNDDHSSLESMNQSVKAFRPQTDYYSMCIDSLRQICHEKKKCSVSFMKGALSPERHRSEKVLAKTAVVLLLLALALAASMFVRSYRYQDMRKQFGQDQAAIFEQVFPNSRKPAGILTRFKSEHKRLSGASGANDELPARVSSIRVLKQFLTSLPSDFPFKITEMRIDGASIRIDGEVNQHSDAGQIAQKLRAFGFEVEPPTTRLLSGGEVAFAIDAKILTDTSEVLLTDTKLPANPGVK